MFHAFGFSVNESKTEWIRVHRLPRADEEGWRRVRQLGNLLGDKQDADRRMHLAAAAFRSLKHVWARAGRVSLGRRIRLYNAYVLPVLTYNCGAWGLNIADMGKLAACHRRQMRGVLGIRWPETISNEALGRTPGVVPFEAHVQLCRLRLLGHVLRLDKDSPAQRSMDLYFGGGARLRGRPRWCLPQSLKSDLAKAGMPFYSKDHLSAAREVAADREAWKGLVREIAGAAPDQE